MPGIDILGIGTTLDSSGNVFPTRWTATGGANWDHLLLSYAPAGSTYIYIHGLFSVPGDYLSNPLIAFDWTTVNASPGNAVWLFQYRAIGGNNVESLDQAGTQESVFTIAAGPSASRRRILTGIPLIAGNFSPLDLVEFRFGVDRANGSNTLTDYALLHALRFEYSN